MLVCVGSLCLFVAVVVDVSCGSEQVSHVRFYALTCLSVDFLSITLIVFNLHDSVNFTHDLVNNCFVKKFYK